MISQIHEFAFHTSKRIVRRETLIKCTLSLSLSLSVMEGFFLDKLSKSNKLY